MLIDCEQCAMQGTSACDDCVVTFLLADGPRGPRRGRGQRTGQSGRARDCAAAAAPGPHGRGGQAERPRAITLPPTWSSSIRWLSPWG